jgi:hypothetical protein
LTAANPWKEGDLIKNPFERQFSTYSEVMDAFVGSLKKLHHAQMYMVYSAEDNAMRISGEKLHADSMKITVLGDAQWSALPCLLDEPASVTNALAAYYNDAGTGDLIKAHDRFAFFSEDKKWVGDLHTLYPGEGYLFRRMAAGSKQIKFFNQSKNNAPKRAQALNGQPSAFSNMKAATNMTIIAAVKDLTALTDLKVFVNDELCAVASPYTVHHTPYTEDEVLYFLTIQSDNIGSLRFELNGETLVPEIGTIDYCADAHAGSLKAPVVLKRNDAGVYKRLENDQVVIIKNNEKYDVTGKKL